MKREWIQTAQDSLCIILNHLLIIAGAITVMDLFRAAQSYVLLWSLTVCIPFVFYHVTSKKPNLIPPAMFVVALGGMSLIEKIMETPDWSAYYYVIIFIYLIGYFVYYFIKQFSKFLVVNQRTASNIPIQDIFQNGISLTLLFSACSAVVLMISANVDWVKAVMERVWYVMQAFLRYIFSGLKTEEQPQGKPPTSLMGPEIDEGIGGGIVPDANADLFRNVMIVILFIAAILGTILLIYYIYYIIKDWEGFKRRKKNKDVLAENEDVREYCGIEKRAPKKSLSFLFRNNREKVRRMYQKKVVKHKKELVGEKDPIHLKYLTAKECCDKLAEQQLKLVYEKARYSEEEISAEDVRLAK